MKKIVLLLIYFLISCDGTKGVRHVNLFNCPIEFIEPNFEFDFVLTDFQENMAFCATEGIPYALLIGYSKDPRLPKKLTIFSRCNNNKYALGTKMIIVPDSNPSKETTLKPIYFTKDTLVNGIKYRKILGCENKVIWGSPKE